MCKLNIVIDSVDRQVLFLPKFWKRDCLGYGKNIYFPVVITGNLTQEERDLFCPNPYEFINIGD